MGVLPYYITPTPPHQPLSNLKNGYLRKIEQHYETVTTKEQGVHLKFIDIFEGLMASFAFP